MNSSGSISGMPVLFATSRVAGGSGASTEQHKAWAGSRSSPFTSCGGERRSDKTRRKPCRHSSAVMGRSRRKAGSSSRARQSSCKRCRQSGSRFWLQCDGRARSDCSCPLHIWAPCVIARIGSVGRLSLPGRHRGASGKRQDDEYRGEPSMRVHCAENLSRSPL